MSMTYSTFSCSRCDYESQSCVSWGFFKYDTPADVWIDRRFGVCLAVRSHLSRVSILLLIVLQNWEKASRFRASSSFCALSRSHPGAPGEK